MADPEDRETREIWSPQTFSMFSTFALAVLSDLSPFLFSPNKDTSASRKQESCVAGTRDLSPRNHQHLTCPHDFHRKLEVLLAKMGDISQTFLLQSVPGPLRRKRSKPS
jgi:hypothetical protein